MRKCSFGSAEWAETSPTPTRMHLKLLLLTLIAVAALSGTVSAQAADIDEEFEAANEFYEDKEYANAIRLYQSILDSGVESAPLYFNLANAYFKEGDLGHAVLYYLKAERLDPSDQDIRHNLEFARQFSQVQMAGVPLNPITGLLNQMVGGYKLSTLGWISSLFFILLIGSLIWRFGLGNRTVLVKTLTIVSLVLVVAAGSLTTYKYYSDYFIRRAVIVAEEAPVHTGPSDRSDVELEGAPGLVVEIVGEDDGFYDVIFENNRRGWIKKDLVARV